MLLLPCNLQAPVETRRTVSARFSPVGFGARRARRVNVARSAHAFSRKQFSASQCSSRRSARASCCGNSEWFHTPTGLRLLQFAKQHKSDSSVCAARNTPIAASASLFTSSPAKQQVAKSENAKLQRCPAPSSSLIRHSGARLASFHAFSYEFQPFSDRHVVNFFGAVN